MQNPRAAIYALPRQAPPRRYASAAFVGLVHIVLIYALVTGLKPQLAPVTPRDFSTRIIEAQIEKPKETPKPVQPVLEKPTLNTAVAPEIRIDRPQQSPIDVAPTSPQPAADTQASAIGSTHSTPSYPPVARRLNHQGTVQLRLAISPEGAVMRADIVRSSGYAELDDTAVSWVVVHWRYRPAVLHGVPVASTAMAAVKFNIELAR